VVVFQTQRLLVRPWTHGRADLARLFDMYSRPEVVRWLGSLTRPLASLVQAGEVVDRWSGRADADRGLGIWAVQIRDTGLIAGTVVLVELPGSGGSGSTGSGDVEVGWHLHPDSWGQGYATEAAAGAIAYGFAQGFTEIYAVVRPGNDPSMAVCRRLGMTPLGLTDRWYDIELEAFRVTSPPIASIMTPGS
jgi:RimJ/RimL family protein N-acetyltransferase